MTTIATKSRPTITRTRVRAATSQPTTRKASQSTNWLLWNLKKHNKQSVAAILSQCTTRPTIRIWGKLLLTKMTKKAPTITWKKKAFKRCSQMFKRTVIRAMKKKTTLSAAGALKLHRTSLKIKLRSSKDNNFGRLVNWNLPRDILLRWPSRESRRSAHVQLHPAAAAAQARIGLLKKLFQINK